MKAVMILILLFAQAFAQSNSEVLSAKGIFESLKKKGLPIVKECFYTEETDPNRLLGRPGQYTGKVNWHDERDTENGQDKALNYTVEVFALEKDLERRRKYIEAITNSASVFAEYQYVHKNALLRIHHNLTPKQAAEYEKALKSL